MKLVIDTNLLISGSLWDGPPARLLDAVERGRAVLVSSPELLAEFAEVISRPRFLPRLTARATTADQLSRKLADKVIIASTPVLSLPPELRDRDDLPVIERAVAARADAIVAGDDDLLAMQSFEGIPIITAVEALRRLGLAAE